jgi:hypothetical protein
MMPLFERGRLEIEVSHIHPKLSWYSPGLFIFLLPLFGSFSFAIPPLEREALSSIPGRLESHLPAALEARAGDEDAGSWEVGDTLFCPFRQAHRLVLE